MFEKESCLLLLGLGEGEVRGVLTEMYLSKKIDNPAKILSFYIKHDL